jgi:hypothetical protein
MRAERSFQTGQQLVQRPPLGRQHLQQHHAGKDAVAFRHMPGKANAPTFLEAEQHVTLAHLSTDILEADACLDELEAMVLAHAVDHRGRGQGLDHPAGGLAIVDVVMQQQADQLVC